MNVTRTATPGPLFKTTYKHGERSFDTLAGLCHDVGPESFDKAIRNPAAKVEVHTRQLRRQTFGESFRDALGTAAGVTATLGLAAGVVGTIYTGFISPEHIGTTLKVVAGVAAAAGATAGVVTYREDRREPSPHASVSQGFLFEGHQGICIGFDHGGDPYDMVPWNLLGDVPRPAQRELFQ